MSKKKTILAVCILVLAGVVFGSGMLAGAAVNGAGSQNDPVVSLSYLEYRLGQLELNGGSASSGYMKMTLSKGDVLTPGEGSLLVIVSGNASVCGSSGLICLTDGSLLESGYTAAMYNQFLVPSSSSGIRADSNVELFVLKSGM